MIATDRDGLRHLLKEYERHDELVFDLETRYTPSPEELERLALVEGTRTDARSVDDVKWLESFKMRATDPLLNEIIWFGLSTFGRADSIACGHPNGVQLKPARKESTPAYDLFGPDDPRSYTKTGKPSMRGVVRAMPAEFAPPPPQLSLDEVIETFVMPLFFSGRTLINQQIKFDLKTLRKHLPDFPQVPIRDPIIEQHILNENLSSYKLGPLVERHFGHTYEKLGAKGVTNFSFNKAALYAQQDARFVWLLDRKLMARLRSNPTFIHMFEQIEMPVYQAFMEMEYAGISIDQDMMQRLRGEREKAVAEILERLIVDYDAPTTFNPNATVDKGRLLYKQYKAPVTKQTKGGKAGNRQPSTDAETLEIIAQSETPAAPVAQLLLDYADQSKTLGTYLIGMSNKIDTDGKVHSDFVLHGTKTGRISSREPNLTNIPREDEMREMFYAPPGYVFVVGDYDQIELRLIGDRSEDPAMIEVFDSGEDVHLATASKVMNLPIDHPDVKRDRTPKGKTPNFLIGYGGGPKLLAAKTGISVAAATAVEAAYFRAFRRINPWKAKVLREARGRAKYVDNRLAIAPYVETWHGRRRRLPNLLLNPDRADTRQEWGRLMSLRGEAERQGVNAIIQGTAAEICKIAMIDVRQFVREEKYPMEMLLMVHDEIITLVPEAKADEAKGLLNELMSGVRSPVTGEKPLKHIQLVTSCGVMERWKKE